RLHAASDLDLIVIYDGQDADVSEGLRPLSTRPYYARLTQALVTALTAPMAEGRLYEVDMRLRPSGRQGPVATAFAGFETYQMEEAWTWEHLALTRARVIAGDAALAEDVEAVRCRVLAAKADGATVLSDVAEMRARIASAKTPDSPWDAKIGAGRLQDVELAAQALALRGGVAAVTTAAQIDAGVSAGLLSTQNGALMHRAADLCWHVQASAQLLSGGSIDPDKLGEGGKRLLARETQTDDLDDLARVMEETCSAAAGVIAAVLGESG
ncbi:MAG: glutamine-synthetase adenylyltransferase, partial [Octadecabacter sp.]|nr:glutamine-synthetase adenylyltransferase [Octadecabacter sp.]